MTSNPTTAATAAGIAAPPPPSVASDDALRAGKPPVGTGSSPLFAQLIALSFIGLGVVAVQHLLVSLGSITSTSWLSATVDGANGIKGDSVLVLVVGVVAAVLGVLLLPVVFKPRPRKGLALTAYTGVHLRPRDLARIAQSRLEGTDAVTGITVKARRRKIRVVATTVAGKDRNSELATELRGRLETALAPLEKQPRVIVRLRNEGI